MSTSGGYNEYIGGCSVNRSDIMMHVGDTMSTLGKFSTSEDIMSTSGGYNEYIGGCSINRRDIMMHVGDTMSTSGDIMSTLEYVQHIRGIS